MFDDIWDCLGMSPSKLLNPLRIPEASASKVQFTYYKLIDLIFDICLRWKQGTTACEDLYCNGIS